MIFQKPDKNMIIYNLIQMVHHAINIHCFTKENDTNELCPTDVNWHTSLSWGIAKKNPILCTFSWGHLFCVGALYFRCWNLIMECFGCLGNGCLQSWGGGGCVGGCVGPRGGRVYGPNKHCGQLSLRCLNTNPIISNKENAKQKLDSTFIWSFDHFIELSRRLCHWWD